MSRTQKDTVSYFPHDANESAGDVLTVLEGQFGNAGYVFWFKLKEKLAATDGHALDCSNEKKWQLLLARARVDEATGQEMMKALVVMEAVDRELWEKRRVIWCQELVDDIADVYVNRRRAVPQKPVFTEDNGKTTPEKAITTDGNQQSKVEYIKELCIGIFDHWNSQGIIVHQKMTDEMRAAITRALKDYAGEIIMAAITNYAAILHDNGYFFKYKWTLREFLKRGLEKFLDIEVAKSNFRRDGCGKDKHSREVPDRGSYTPGPDYHDED